MPFVIVRGNITRMKTDAIVNAANTQLAMGGGVCGAIFNAAGPEELQKACWKACPVETGKAAITPGFRLRAKYVIHAVGPVYDSRRPGQCEKLLRSAYLSSLILALENGCRSIAFPLISSGIYGYPKREALLVAADACRDFLSLHEMLIYLAIFDPSSFQADRALLRKIQKFAAETCKEPEKPGKIEENLTFSATLRHLMALHGKNRDETVKKANMTSEEFEKLQNAEKPEKAGVLAAALALELTLKETEKLLESAGYTLSHGSQTDLAAEYFIRHGNYDIFRLNEILFSLGEPLLGPELPK